MFLTILPVKIDLMKGWCLFSACQLNFQQWWGWITFQVFHRQHQGRPDEKLIHGRCPRWRPKKHGAELPRFFQTDQICPWYEREIFQELKVQVSKENGRKRHNKRRDFQIKGLYLQNAILIFLHWLACMIVRNCKMISGFSKLNNNFNISSSFPPIRNENNKKVLHSMHCGAKKHAMSW